MLFSQLLALSLALSPSVVSAALFPENTLVKMLDHKGFKNAMKENVCMLCFLVILWLFHLLIISLVREDDFYGRVRSTLVWALSENGTRI